MSNKKIIKNSLFLYFRLLFVLGLGLFTARVVLQVLGIEDYGIYSIVGGLVSIFAFLQNSLSGAGTRFLNVGMVGDKKDLKVIFNTILVLHIILAFIVFVLGETLGLWFFYNKLNIPESKYNVAFWVYQISIISIIFAIIQIPYHAALIAHEKMNTYAYISILDASLKLIIVYIASLSSDNRLLFYAILVLIVSIIIRIIYQIYCTKNFYECKFSFLFDKKVFKKVFHFFGWDLYGNMCVVVNNQGFGIIQNIFFGPIINTSITIVNQLQGGLLSLGNNFTLAAKPQLIQSYIKNDYERMNILLQYVCKLSFSLMLTLALPLSFNTEFILKIWLNEVPIYTETFLKISLLTAIINITFAIFIPVIHATGKVFLISFLTGSIYLLNLPITYILLKMGFDPTIPYYSIFLISIIAGMTNLYIAHMYIPDINVINLLKKTLLPLGSIYLALYILFTIGKSYISFNPMLEILLMSTITIMTLFLIVLNKNEKNVLYNLVKKYLK